MKGHIFLRLAFLVIFLLGGYFVSKEINSFLSISFSEKDSPESREAEIVIAQDSSGPLALRMVDLGGVGIVLDPENWGDNYEHNVHRFEDLILSGPPYIDQAAADRITAEFQEYIDLMSSRDYNAIAIPGFLEFVNFDLLQDGLQVYSKEDDYRARHLALRNYFNTLIQYAREKDMKVFMYTDMVTFTPKLMEYFLKTEGRIDTERTTFWKVYGQATAEMFSEMPGVSGLLIRIGEAGSVYNKPGWDYYSELWVRTDVAVQTMLREFLAVAEQYDKEIIFRTWSVGVGQVGDMHTNPSTYERILGNISSDRLIVSTKYSNGDYYSWLPFNKTLYQGSHRRIMEFQCRREFEGLGAIPNFVAPLYQQALLEAQTANPQIEGMWLWAQEGGPLRAGPISIYPFHGFNLVTDINVYVMSQVAIHPQIDILTAVAEWISMNFGDDPALIEALTEVWMQSHEVARKGLYIGTFARYYVQAMGLEPPPMMWIFEWDIVGGSSSALGSVYFVSRNAVDDAIAEGAEALAGIQQMKRLAESVKSKVTNNRTQYETLLDAMDFQEHLFEVLAAYRLYFLNYYRWIDTGSKEAKLAWKAALDHYRTLEAAHTAQYAYHPDFPAYQFEEANHGTQLAAQSIASAWMSRTISFVVLFSILLMLLGRGGAALSSFWRSIMNPYTLSNPDSGDDAKLPWLIIFMVTFGGIFALGSFSAPFFSAWLIGVILLYYLLWWLLTFKKAVSVRSLNVATLVAPSLLLILLPLACSTLRGPNHFWYLFWTNPAFRTVFITLFVAASLWIYFVLYVRLTTAFGYRPIEALSKIIFIQGVVWLVGAVSVQWMGFEYFLTSINDELLVLPAGLSRIMGITTHLNIPLGIPIGVMKAGVALMVLAVILHLATMKRKKAD